MAWRTLSHDVIRPGGVQTGCFRRNPMVRIRHGSPVVVAVVVFGLALALFGACKKDDKKSDPATGDKAGQKSGDVEKPMSGVAAMAMGAEDLSLLPLDSELVLGINVAQVQQSALWKQFV